MASGKVHSIATLLVAPFGIMQMPTDSAGFAWALGAITAMIVTPDLDLLDSSGNYSQYIIRETFPPQLAGVADKAWQIYWYPYSRSIGHRSFVSHMPIFSTLVRLIYIFPYVIILSFFLHTDLQYFILAMVSADICHYIMDLKIWRVLNIFRQ